MMYAKLNGDVFLVFIMRPFIFNLQAFRFSLLGVQVYEFCQICSDMVTTYLRSETVLAPLEFPCVALSSIVSTLPSLCTLVTIYMFPAPVVLFFL